MTCVPQPTLMDTDTDLLQRFRQTRDEAAFRGLVIRHAPMVMGVAWRRTGDKALSEEITQTVFTIFARKAPSLHHSELAGWLHRTAFLETRNACRRESRRLSALRKLAAQSDMSPLSDSRIVPVSPQPGWEELQPHLDEALSRLRPDERQLVVLRYFEQRSYGEIAQVTGKTEEASRKQMQRSLDRLGIHLRRHGILTTGTAMGTVLGGQTLSMPAASAATLTAVALQGGAGITAATLFIHTIYTMSTATILKTTAITVLVAAIPLGWLWTENQSLKQDVARLRAEASARSAFSSPAAGDPPPGGAKLPAKSPGTPSPVPAATASSNASGTAGDSPPFGVLFNAETIVKLAESQMKHDAATELNRLSLRLQLTSDQKEKLSIFLQKQKAGELAQLKRIQSSGLLDKAMKTPDGLSEDENEALTALNAADAETSIPDTDQFLKTLLTPEQHEEYTRSEQERRVTRTETEANGVVESLAGQMDLTPDQKDRIFQGIAALGLKREEEAARPMEGSARMSVTLGSSGSSGNGPSATEVAMLNADPQHEALLKEILTPEQFETYQVNRAREVEHGKEVLKSFMPKSASTPPAEASGTH